MGSVTSAGPRRISFDNQLIETPLISKPIEANVTDIIPIEPKVSAVKALQDNEGNDTDIKLENNIKSLPSQEGGDTLNYWNNRLETLEKEHQQIHQILEAEYEKTVQSVNKNFETANSLTIGKLKKVKPCLDWRYKIMQCYERNPHQTLVCSDIVRAFTECVTSCQSPDN